MLPAAAVSAAPVPPPPWEMQCRTQLAQEALLSSTVFLYYAGLLQLSSRDLVIAVFELSMFPWDQAPEPPKRPGRGSVRTQEDTSNLRTWVREHSPERSATAAAASTPPKAPEGEAGAVVGGAVPKVPIKASSGLQVTHVAPLNVAEHVA